MKNISLITIDVTNTIFRFKDPPAVVYARSALKYGMICSEKKLQRSMGLALAETSKRHPNYGAATGIQSSHWWNTVVHQTFNGTFCVMLCQIPL